MAALTVTPAQVLFVSGTKETGVAAEAITAGAVLYRLTDNTIGLADNDAAGKTVVIGVALNAAGAGQTVTWAKPGSVVTIGAGAAPAVGYIYCLDDTAGLMIAAGELASPSVVSVVGICSAANTLTLHEWNTGIVSSGA